MSDPPGPIEHLIEHLVDSGCAIHSSGGGFYLDTCSPLLRQTLLVTTRLMERITEYPRLQFPRVRTGDSGPRTVDTVTTTGQSTVGLVHKANIGNSILTAYFLTAVVFNACYRRKHMHDLSGASYQTQCGSWSPML